MNSHVQYRGLPPPPCGAYIPVGDQTPLSTPDLYSHTGIYDVIPAQENEVSRKAPAPPRRSPSTKLSTSSNASDDVIHSTPYHPYGPQQPGSSPRNQRKHSAQVSPPHNVAKPFSYAPPSPSDLRRASEPIQYVPNERSSNSPKYDVPSFHGGPMYEAVPSSHYSSMMAHESQGYYNPARVHSPSHLSQSPGSPKLHRQSSGSPRLARKNSDRNRLIPVEAVSPPVVDKPHGQSGHGPPSFPAPPPPLPTAAKFIAAMTQKSRSPSPPLPPPPPELIDSSGKIMSPQASLRQRAMQSTLQINTSPQPVTEEPPTPPPISKIPGTRSSVSSFEIGKKIHRGDSREASPIPSPTHSSQSIGLAAELSKVKLRTAVVSSNNRSNVTPTSDVNKNFKKDTMGIIAELGQVQLRSVSSPVDSEGEIHNKTDGTENPAVGRVRLNAVKDTGQHGTVIKDTSSGELILPKLRPTGGQKPWEKDISPSSQCSDLSPCGDLPLPPPPPELMEVPPARLMEASHQEFLKPVQPSIDTNSKPITDKYNAPVKKGIKQNRNKESSNHSSMDINLDEIDYSQIPGYVEITAAVPNWKRDMIEKKNKEKLDEYIAMVRRKKEEAEKWKDVPEWKRKLLEEKEREKREKEAEMTQASKTGNKPKSKIHVEERELFVTPSSSHKTPITPPMTSISQQHEPSSLTSNSADDLDLQHVSESSNTNQCHHIETEFYKIERGNAFQKEEEERRRAQKQKQIELAAQMEQEMANVPAWKREIMMKKGGNAPSNWGDEREEINRDDD